MPKKIQADVNVRTAEIRKLTRKLEKLRLSSGAEARRQVEQLAAEIQQHAAIIRAELRKLLE